MRRCATWCLVVLLAVSARARGFITAIYPFQKILDESTHVLVGKLEKVDPKGRTAVAAVARALKGKRDFRRVLMNIGVAPAHHASYLIERMKPGDDVIVFYKQAGKSLQCVAHTHRTWFQLFGTDNPKARDKVWWRMSHLEIYLPRTFDGSTPKLIKLTEDVLARRVKPPPPDPKVRPLDPSRRVARPVVQAVGKGTGGGFARRYEFAHAGGGEIRGVCWADVNGDELLDLVLCRQAGNVLLVSQGDRYLDGTRPWGLPGGSRSAGWADCDGDDHPDFMTNNFDLLSHAGTRLRAESKRLAAPKRRNPEGAGWIDYNGDGLPDLLITNGEHGILLFENTGKNPRTFRDVSRRAGLGRKGLGVGNGDFVVFADYDGDGCTDFLYNLGSGVLARNRGDGTFALDERSGIKLAGGSRHKRGVAVADFDNDGDLDLFIPGPGRAQLYRNNNDGTFTDIAAASGDLAKVRDPSFGAAFGDVNCDGLPDLFVCHTRGPARLYLGDGRGRFADASKAAGVADLAPAFGASFADVDGDGDVDLAVNLPKRIVVAVNEMPRQAGRALLTVRAAVRRGLVGAVVRVLDSSRRPVGMRRLALAEGCGGQTPPVAYLAVTPGECLVTVCLSDGRAAVQRVTVAPKHNKLIFREGQFK